MEQLSFASVYRTAAILAAFSHASAAGEAFDTCSAAARRADGAAAARAPLALRSPLLGRCMSLLRQPREPVPASSPRAYPDPCAEASPGCVVAQSGMGPHRPCVTSHFAFAEQPDRGG